MSEIKINTVVVSGKELNKGIFKQLDNVLCFYDQWKDEHPTGKLIGRVYYPEASCLDRRQKDSGYICHLLIQVGSKLLKLPVHEPDMCWGDCAEGRRIRQRHVEREREELQAIPQIFLRS
jgi:hypothetical protein